MKILTEDSEGNVWVQDDKADGTIVVLVCKGAAPRGKVAGPVVPEKPREWPLGLERLLNNRPLPSVTINTTHLPPGKQAFDVDAFTAQADEALQRGETELVLEPATAGRWGWQESTTAEREHPPEQLA